MKFDVVSIGSATKDIFLFTKDSNLKRGIDRHFLEVPLDQKIEIEKRLEFSGGSATNSAASFAKFGKNAAVIAKIGNDYNGGFILDDLSKRGISTEYVIRGSGETPFTNVLVSTNRHMIILTYRGMESSLKAEEIRLDFESKWLFVGPLPGNAYKILPVMIDYCKLNDIKIALNPGSTELGLKLKRMAKILKDVNVISMNDDEAGIFVGYGNDVKNLVKLAKTVKDTAIITKGDKGSLVADSGNIYRASAYPSKQINFIGAGDAYFAGFMNGLIDSKDIEESISLGSYNASSVTMHYGAKDGIVSGYPVQELKIRRQVYEKKRS
jgi:sugar/nucleoside kinase (ribokinase family)